MSRYTNKRANPNKSRNRGDRIPTVLHLDHSTEPGGAELALLRILLHHDQWTPILRIPRPGSGQSTAGVFEPLRKVSPRVISFAGAPQKPGASGQKVGISRAISFAAGAFLASIQLRFSSAYRQADIIHANTSRSAVYGALACLTSQKKLVVHLRDETSAASLGPAGFQLFSRVALRRANAVIANSRATLATAEPFLRIKTDRTVIASPIGFDSRTERRMTADSVRRIGMVARIDPWKGHALLLRAFAISVAGSNTRLVLAGGASFGKKESLTELEKLAEDLGIRDRVDFLGHVDDVRSIIDQLDVCVQASIRPEPLGQNVLQYLVAGKPIIAVNAGGPAEWIRSGENGVLVEMNSVDSMTAALNMLISDKSMRERMSFAAEATEGIGTDAEVASAHGRFFELVLSNEGSE